MLGLAMTTRGETADRIAGPLAERGIDVRYLRTTGTTRSLSEPRSGSDVRAATEPADAEAFDVGFVYPSRLTEGAVIDAQLDLPWLNDREAILTSRNKAGVLARLARGGVSVPETVLVSNPIDEPALREVFERFDPPVVVKPTAATRGIGVTKVDDLDSFLGVCDYLSLVHDFPATGDKSFLVQEYLADAHDYRFMVIDGECVGAVERRGRGWKHNVHRGARAVGVSPPAPLASLAERVSRLLDISYVGVDLLVADGDSVVTETNARPTVDDASKYHEHFYDALAALISDTAKRAE